VRNAVKATPSWVLVLDNENNLTLYWRGRFDGRYVMPGGPFRSRWDEEDVCAGLGEANGKGLADATGAAGDEGSLALEGER
jgi:hypothetical protein